MLIGYQGVPLPKGIGNYVTDDGVIRDDNGNPVVTTDVTVTPDISTTVFDPHCDPNAAYPTGSVCWGIQQGIDAKAIAQSLVPKTTAPCLGTPIVKGVSNCVLVAGVGAAFLFFMMDRHGI